MIVSWYSPALGGVNCDIDCATLAGGTPAGWGYGRSIACPAEFEIGTVFHIADVGMRQCFDRGGAIVCDWWPSVARHACVVDVQSREPLVTDWVNVDGRMTPFRVRAAVVPVSDVAPARQQVLL